MGDFGKVFIILGIVLIIIGLAYMVLPRIPLIGKLPGDIYIKRDNFTFYFPIASSILISILVSIILKIFNR